MRSARASRADLSPHAATVSRPGTRRARGARPFMTPGITPIPGVHRGGSLGGGAQFLAGLGEELLEDLVGLPLLPHLQAGQDLDAQQLDLVVLSPGSLLASWRRPAPSAQP